MWKRISITIELHEMFSLKAAGEGYSKVMTTKFSLNCKFVAVWACLQWLLTDNGHSGHNGLVI